MRSTIDAAWIWEDGGAYLGVPISNFAGWYLTVFAIDLLFALCLYRSGRNEPIGQGKVYWVLPAMMYLGLSVEYLFGPFTHSTNLDIYWQLFLVAIFTMVFASILNIILVSRMDKVGIGALPRARWQRE
jgi:putative membrane protein